MCFCFSPSSSRDIDICCFWFIAIYLSRKNAKYQQQLQQKFKKKQKLEEMTENRPFVCSNMQNIRANIYLFSYLFLFSFSRSIRKIFIKSNLWHRKKVLSLHLALFIYIYIHITVKRKTLTTISNCLFFFFKNKKRNDPRSIYLSSIIPLLCFCVLVNIKDMR